MSKQKTEGICQICGVKIGFYSLYCRPHADQNRSFFSKEKLKNAKKVDEKWLHRGEISNYRITSSITNGS